MGELKGCFGYLGMFSEKFFSMPSCPDRILQYVLAPEKEEEGKYELENDDKELSIGLRIELIK